MEISKRISQLYTKTSVFKDKDVLKKGHHPRSLDEVIHRDEIINKLLTVLQESMKGKVPDNVFIYGTFGTGKTMLTRLITSELALAAKEFGNKIITVYVYCETVSAPSPLMQFINQSIVDELKERKKIVGISKARNFDYFYELVDKADAPIIIIFDEIDKLKEPDIINQLSRIKECSFTKNNVCMIGITNDTNFYDHLDGRTKSIIGQNEIFVPPYDAYQLIDILQARAKYAFEDNVYDNLIIQLCAAFGAQENGDARTAIDILRTAGDRADERGSKIVEEQDVRSAKDGMELNRQFEVVKGLPIQTKSVLYSCLYNYKKKGVDVETTEIYATYLKVCEIICTEIVKPRRVNDYIGELNTLGILTVNKVSRGRKKGVYNAIKPLVDPEALERVILQDNNFKQLRPITWKDD